MSPTVVLLAALAVLAESQDAPEALRRVGARQGICAVVDPGRDALPVDLARTSDLILYVQCADAARVALIRRLAEESGFLGTRIHVDRGGPEHLHLADQLADGLIAPVTLPRAEALRVLRPGAKALLGDEEILKTFPEGIDEWTHPYHGPDNNPHSNDRLARGPFLTQFMATPWYGVMPQMSVFSGGRVFRIWGNRTSAQSQWEQVHTLLCTSAWNGTVLWERKLSPGFMVHRNTVVATPDLLYVADGTSCKRIDAATGEVRDEITAPQGLCDGPVWKWMALEKGILYALAGEKEKPVETYKSGPFRFGGWSWWSTSRDAHGFGRTVFAVEAATKKVLWHHRQEDPIDSRAMCLAGGRLFLYSHGRSLAALDAATGQVRWRTADEKLLAAIGDHDAAQHPSKGFSSSAYAKATEKAIFFAGPQRTRIVAVSAGDGRLLWELPGGNSQLILRDDVVYALGQGEYNKQESSLKIQAMTGEVLARYPARDRCTRATGSAQYIFTRGGFGGSTAVFDVTSAQPRMTLLSPMRPACQDGVIVANGQFYWGPWMCGCDGTQVGVICLAPAAGFDYAPEAKAAERLEGPRGPAAPFEVAADDWPTFRKDNARGTRAACAFPAKPSTKWEFAPGAAVRVTAPVAAGSLVFAAWANGVVRALDLERGREVWKAYVGGDVKYPPSIGEGRCYVGSGDGWIYCLEAATGKLLWRFRAAPAERKIPLFGTLSSTWPVAGGVLVQDGVAYAAAGNANFDGTHVYALDARTGEIRWQNHTSGHLEGARSGAGVQGHLLLLKDALWSAGGNLVGAARYDLKDGSFTRGGRGRGKDLYVLDGSVRAGGVGLYARPEDTNRIAFAAFPVDNRYIAVADQSQGYLKGDASVVGLVEGRDAQGRLKFTWSARPFMDTNAVVLGKEEMLVAGVNRTGEGRDVRTTAGLAAMSMADGKILWEAPLPGAPVGWGLAVPSQGCVLVGLQDGRILRLGN